MATRSALPEQARIVHLLVERVTVGEGGIDVQLRLDGATFAVRIPMTFQSRGGRKRIFGPGGEPVVVDPPMPARVDDALVRALAKAWRWKRMLEGGGYASIGDLAKAEKVNFSYLCRVLRLNMLPPVMVEAILDGGQGKGGGFTRCWPRQTVVSGRALQRPGRGRQALRRPDLPRLDRTRSHEKRPPR